MNEVSCEYVSKWRDIGNIGEAEATGDGAPREVDRVVESASSLASKSSPILRSVTAGSLCDQSVRNQSFPAPDVKSILCLTGLYYSALVLFQCYISRRIY